MYVLGVLAINVVYLVEQPLHLIIQEVVRMMFVVLENMVNVVHHLVLVVLLKEDYVLAHLV
jgi:hypothetical protein